MFSRLFVRAIINNSRKELFDQKNLYVWGFVLIVYVVLEEVQQQQQGQIVMFTATVNSL